VFLYRSLFVIGVLRVMVLLQRSFHNSPFPFFLFSSNQKGAGTPLSTPLNCSQTPKRYFNGHISAAVASPGSNPFHFAEINRRTNAVFTLLLHRDHANRPNKRGITPEIVARENGRM